MANRCPLGVALNESCNNECNEAFYVLTDEEKTLLQLRAGHLVTSVCNAHRIAYLKLYVSNQRKCCDHCYPPTGISLLWRTYMAILSVHTTPDGGWLW